MSTKIMELLQQIIKTAEAVGDAVEAMAYGDVIGACRIDREINGLMEEFDMDGLDGTTGKLVCYLMESAERIAAISRQIASAPDMDVAVEFQIEAREVAKAVRGTVAGATRLVGNCGEDLFPSADDVREARNRVGRAIASHSRLMGNNDFGDDGFGYAYLRLLNNLYTFFNAFEKIIRKHEI